jgi:cysteinyl-tRNA synthetase
LIELFNTYTSRKEPLAKQPGETVSMYVCGLTPKNHPHIGHAWLFVHVDVMRRYLEFSGYKVDHVQNFTDVDDKIIEAGHRDGIPPDQAAARYIDSYWKGMDALGVKRPTKTPYATDFIPQMIDVIQGLIAKGYAYESRGDVYYRAEHFKDYGKLSGNSIDQLVAGSRVDVGESKESPADFALWKAAKPGEPQWDSPWSQGRPGWHIECSTMILHELGEVIDVHWGGRDLIFPHHENEIAQTEAFTGKHPSVRIWQHVGLMQTGAEKMSHSLGNFTTVHEMIEHYGADALRMYLVAEHYRVPASFTPEYIARAGERLKRLKSAQRNLGLLTSWCQARESGGDTFDTGKLADALLAASDESLAQFKVAMDDDLTTPRAVAAIEALAKRINTTNDEVAKQPQLATTELLPALERAGDALRQMAVDVLGLDLAERTAATAGTHVGAGAATSGTSLTAGHASAGGEPPIAEVDEAAIQALVDQRTEARKRRDFGEADRIRDELVGIGITIEDRPQGTIWYRQ